MYNMNIQGTKDQKLISYIERVYNNLGLYQFEDCFIDIDFQKECSGGAGGYCDGDQEEIQVELARQDSVGRIPMNDLKINIAHELVHAQQIASGRLVNKGFVFRNENDGSKTLTSKQIFEGKEYIGVRYDEQPWEIEAYKLEKEIFEACK